MLPCKKFTPQIWALSKPHFWNFYRPLPCEPPFERRIRRAAAVRAAQRTRRNNRFCRAYIEIYMFFWQPISYSNFTLCCIVNDKCNSRQHYEKSYTAMYVVVCDEDLPYSTHWLHSTHWPHSTLFTVFYTLTLHSTHWHCILLYLPYFYCISLFQASVALMFTDLNLVLLLYYFIIALSRFLNLKWALCLIKSKLKVNGLRGLPRVTPKVASNSHHCFSVCFLIQASNWRLFDLPGVSGVT